MTNCKTRRQILRYVILFIKQIVHLLTRHVLNIDNIILYLTFTWFEVSEIN